MFTGAGHGQVRANGRSGDVVERETISTRGFLVWSGGLLVKVKAADKQPDLLFVELINTDKCQTKFCSAVSRL